MPLHSRTMLWAISLFILAANFSAATLATAADAPFRRGNINDDAAVDISDPIVLLAYLFNGGEEPGCMDSADTNDDGQNFCRKGGYMPGCYKDADNDRKRKYLVTSCRFKPVL